MIKKMKNKNLFNMDVDLINGPLLKSLLIFSIPLLISSVFQQLYSFFDTMIVGNYLGDSKLAAVGASTPIFELLIGLAIGIGNGLSIVAARSFGSKDEELLKKSVATSIVIGLVSSFVISILGLLTIKPLLTALNTPEHIFNDSYRYIYWIALFTPVMFLYNLCAGLLRAIGNSFMPLVFLIISSLLNIVLDIFFISNLKMGIEGAAIATVIAQGVSVVLSIIYILKKEEILRPEKVHFKVDNQLYKEMLSQGLSMGFMSSIVSIGSVILQYGINGLGYLTVAGHISARKVYTLFNIPFLSMALSISTFVPQNMGAKKYKRIRDGLKIAFIYDLIMAAIVSILLLLFSRDLIRIISGSDNPIILDNGSLYLKIVGPFYAVLEILLQTRFALQGLCKKILPLISSIIELIRKILFVQIFIPKHGYLAVIFCEPVIWVVMTIQLLYSFYTNEYIREARSEKVR